MYSPDFQSIPRPSAGREPHADARCCTKSEAARREWLRSSVGAPPEYA